MSKVKIFSYKPKLKRIIIRILSTDNTLDSTSVNFITGMINQKVDEKTEAEAKELCLELLSIITEELDDEPKIKSNPLI